LNLFGALEFRGHLRQRRIAESRHAALPAVTTAGSIATTVLISADLEHFPAQLIDLFVIAGCRLAKPDISTWVFREDRNSA
jgi:hypothetical protein